MMIDLAALFESAISIGPLSKMQERDPTTRVERKLEP